MSVIRRSEAIERVTRMLAGGHDDLFKHEIDQGRDFAERIVNEVVRITNARGAVAALQEIAARPVAERNPDGVDQAAHTMRLIAREALVALGEATPKNEDATCGRMLVGQGGDTYDPECALPRGHSGFCRPGTDPLRPFSFQVAPEDVDASGPSSDASGRELDLRLKMAAALAFVEAFAETETYGGGRRAKLWIGDQFLDATDGWKGDRAAKRSLAERLIRKAKVMDVLPPWPEPDPSSSGQRPSTEPLDRRRGDDTMSGAAKNSAYADHVNVVLLDQPEEECCEERGWVSVDVPEDTARDLLAGWCSDEDGNMPARPAGPAKRVWLASDDLSKPADEQRWQPCEPGDGVEFYEFDVTDVVHVRGEASGA